MISEASTSPMPLSFVSSSAEAEFMSSIMNSVVVDVVLVWVVYAVVVFL